MLPGNASALLFAACFVATGITLYFILSSKFERFSDSDESDLPAFFGPFLA
jgi:hypothetical protein